MQDYHQLDIWKRGMDYAAEIYQFAATLPEYEKYNLGPQLRRAAISIPLNIAEGCGASGNTEFARFLGIAYRSLKEVGACLELCQRLYPDSCPVRLLSLIEGGDQIAKMMYNLMRKVRPEKFRKPWES